MYIQRDGLPKFIHRYFFIMWRPLWRRRLTQQGFFWTKHLRMAWCTHGETRVKRGRLTALDRLYLNHIPHNSVLDSMFLGKKYRNLDYLKPELRLLEGQIPQSQTGFRMFFSVPWKLRCQPPQMSQVSQSPAYPDRHHPKKNNRNDPWSHR